MGVMHSGDFQMRRKSWLYGEDLRFAATGYLLLVKNE